jgi:hypothetical protein
VASETVSDLGGQCRAVGCGGCASVVSGLCGQGVCQSGSAAETSEVLEVVRMVRGGWVRFRNVQYSSHSTTLNYRQGMFFMLKDLECLPVVLIEEVC